MYVNTCHIFWVWVTSPRFFFYLYPFTWKFHDVIFWCLISIPLYKHTTFSFHLSFGEQMDFSYFWLLWIEQQWTCLRKCLCGRIKHPLGVCLSGTAGSWGRSVPIFLGNHHTEFCSTCITVYSLQQWRSVLTPHPLQHELLTCFVDLGRSDCCEMESQSRFDLYFSDD